MSNLKNAQPRFGLEEAAHTLFDYVTSKSIPIGLIYVTEDGFWNTEEIADLISQNKPIEGAFIPVCVKTLENENDQLRAERVGLQQEILQLKSQESSFAPDHQDKVGQANKDFIDNLKANPAGDKVDKANADFVSTMNQAQASGQPVQSGVAAASQETQDKPAE